MGDYIPHFGMEKGGVTLSVLWSMSVSKTNRNLWHKCHRIFIIHCILVTKMSHQCKICSTNVADFHHILYISDYNVSPMKICGMNVTDFHW